MVIQCNASNIINQIGSTLQNIEVNCISTSISMSVEQIVISEEKYYFIMRKVKLLHKIFRMKGLNFHWFCNNFNDKYFVGGNFLGDFSFGILMDKVVFSCMACSLRLINGGIVVLSIKIIIDFNTTTLFPIENNFNNNQYESIEKVSRQSHIIRFVGEKVICYINGI